MICGVEKHCACQDAHKYHCPLPCSGTNAWGLTMSAHGSLVGSLLLTMVICLPLTDTWLSSITLQPATVHQHLSLQFSSCCRRASHAFQLQKT